MSLEPGEVAAGSWTVVRVAGGTAPATVRFLGRRFPAYPDGKGFRALVPVPLGTAAGKHALIVAFRRGSVKASLSVPRRVEPPRQRVRRVTVGEREAAEMKAGNAVLARAWRDTVPEALWTRALRFPVSGRLTSGYGITRSYGKGAQWVHRGIDIGAPEGWPVVASAPGRVVVSRKLEIYGNAVVIDHGQNVHTAYFHLHTRQAARGSRVEAGQVIGTVGETGLANGPHLHFGTYIGAVAVDPEEMLARGLP